MINVISLPDAVKSLQLDLHPACGNCSVAGSLQVRFLEGNLGTWDGPRGVDAIHSWELNKSAGLPTGVPTEITVCKNLTGESLVFLVPDSSFFLFAELFCFARKDLANIAVEEQISVQGQGKCALFEAEHAVWITTGMCS